MSLTKHSALAVLAIGLVGCLDTQYAPGYTKKSFAKISVGDSKESVLSALGEPLHISRPVNAERWYFEDSGIVAVVSFSTYDNRKLWNRIYRLTDPKEVLGSIEESKKDLDPAIILERLGDPTKRESYTSVEAWHYTISPSSTHYMWKVVVIDSLHNDVVYKESRLWID